MGSKIWFKNGQEFNLCAFFGNDVVLLLIPSVPPRQGGRSLGSSSHGGPPELHSETLGNVCRRAGQARHVRSTLRGGGVEKLNPFQKRPPV